MNLSKPAGRTADPRLDAAALPGRALRIEKMRSRARAIGDDIEMVIYAKKPTRRDDEITFPKLVRKWAINTSLIAGVAFLAVCSGAGVYSGVAEMDASGFLKMVDAVLFTAFCGVLTLCFGAAAVMLTKEMLSSAMRLNRVLGGRVTTEADRRALEEEGDIWGISQAGIYMSLSTGEETTVPWVAIKAVGRDPERPGDIYVALPGAFYRWITDAATDAGLTAFHLEAVVMARWLRWRGRRGLRVVV